MNRNSFSLSVLFKLFVLGLSPLASTGGIVRSAIASPIPHLVQPLTENHRSKQASGAGVLLDVLDALEPSDTSSGEVIYNEFTFQGRAGQEVVITAQREVIETNPYIESVLLHPDGSTLNAKPAACHAAIVCTGGELYRNGAFSGGRFTLPVEGTYRIRVQANRESFMESRIPELLYRLSVRDDVYAYTLLEQVEQVYSQSFELAGIDIENLDDHSQSFDLSEFEFAGMNTENLDDLEFESQEQLNEFYEQLNEFQEEQINELNEQFENSTAEGLRMYVSELEPEGRVGRLVSEAFQLFVAANDTAGQQFILWAYPQYATESTGDDSVLQNRLRFSIGITTNDNMGINPFGDFEPTDFDYAQLAEAEAEKLRLLAASSLTNISTSEPVGASEPTGISESAATAESVSTAESIVASGSTNLGYSQVFQLFYAYIGSGQYQQALESLLAYRSTQLAQSSTPEREHVIEVLSQIAWTYSLLGDYQTSNQTYKYIILAAARGIKAQITENPGTEDLPYESYESPFGSSVVQRQSEFATLADTTLDDFQFFLRSTRNPYTVNQTLPMVAYNYYAMGDYESALALTEVLQRETDELQSLQDAEFPVDPSIPFSVAVRAATEGGGGVNMVVRAFVLSALGRHSEAIALASRSIELGNTSLGSTDAPNGLIVLGKSYYATNNLVKATETYEDLLSRSRRLGDRWSEAYAYSRLAEILTDQGQPELAIAFYKKSVNTRETIRSTNTELSPELRLSFVETISEDYRSLVDLLLQQDRVFEAQEVLDLLRVQELDDYLRTVRANNPVDGILDYWDSEQAILSSYTDSLSAASTIPLDTFANSPTVQASVQTLQRTSSTQVLNPRSLERLRDNLKSLDQAALLYPLVLEDRLEIILVTPDELVSKTIVVSEQTLNQEISQFRSDLVNVSSDPAISGNKLYRRLLEPLESELAEEGIKTLLYAADSQLRYVPLSALHTGSQWVAQQYSVNQITAASLTDFSEADSKNLSVLAGAFSEGEYSFDIDGSRFNFFGLPYAGKEVESIDEDVNNSDAYFNQQFNPTNILPKMANYGVVHFATHAAFLPGSPNNSFILFGNGDRVSLRDIAGWELSNVDLVVLSACQTAVSEDFGSGDEILGFGYQMQRTGARAAIASLWQVDDGGTQVLMNAFYLALENGFSKTEALQRAQQALINDDLTFVGGTGTTRATIGISGGNSQNPDALRGRSDHPYYWAPFILIGNGL